MSRINVTNEDGSHAGHFDWEKAERFDQGKRFDGNNMIGVISGSEWVDEYLYRTAGGRWVRNTDSRRYQDGPDTYHFVTADEARTWLLESQNNDDALERYFGPVPDEEDVRPGRPEIGGRITTALGDDLLAALDAYAAEHGITRAEAVRRMASAGLAVAAR